MTKDKAKSTASALNREGLGGITYEAKPQDWRDGGHWYVKGSDGSAVFDGAQVRICP